MSWIFKNFKMEFVRSKFWKIRSSINLPYVTRCPEKIGGPNGLAVLTFIGYKQTNRHPSKVNKDYRRNCRHNFKDSSDPCRTLLNHCLGKNDGNIQVLFQKIEKFHLRLCSIDKERN